MIKVTGPYMYMPTIPQRMNPSFTLFRTGLTDDTVHKSQLVLVHQSAPGYHQSTNFFVHDSRGPVPFTGSSTTYHRLTWQSVVGNSPLPSFLARSHGHEKRLLAPCCPSVRPSRRISTKFYNSGTYMKLLKKIQIWFKSCKNIGHF